MRKVIVGSLVLLIVVAFSYPAQVRQRKGTAPKPKPEFEENWREWGGPQRDFLTTSAGLFKAGSEKWISNPPKKLWERPLGDGYSAIAVEGKTLYTAYRRDTYDVVIALDASSGKTVWEYVYSAPFKNNYSEGAGPGPYAMPQVIGDRVVTASGIGQIHSLPTSASQQTDIQLPSTPLKFGVFAARFDPGGAFRLEGDRWPALSGSWKLKVDEIELVTSKPPRGCEGSGRYRVRIDGKRVSFELIADDCVSRRMILNGSVWSPAEEVKVIPARHITFKPGARPPKRPEASAANSNWPSFRGIQAAGVAEKQNLPDKWDGKTGENILWRTPIPGLAHSSPVVWGQRVFVTSAVSSDPKASFRPGLYGDGDASQDRSKHRWMIYALDKRTGKILWDRVAHEGAPREKRHIKSTYANSTPATDGRIVVAWFGSQGVFAYDVNGRFLWKVDLGRINLGAYDIPTYEWGPASSPIIWNNLVILQCDTQDDSFLLALDADTGKQVWKTEREELPSWGTPTVAMTSTGPELVTNASNYIRGYDPRTGKELWRLGRSSKITAPTPLFADDKFVIASGRAPERPIFVVKAGARGDLTLPADKTSSDAVVWSRAGRGSYMPTPLVYDGILYVLANNGLLDAYDLKTGEEIYRQRLPLVGSGFSASPVAADGKLYLSNEDGEMLVIAAGRKFEHLATNSMGELLMATPALSEGALYVRSAQSLFAVGRKQ